MTTSFRSAEPTFDPTPAPVRAAAAAALRGASRALDRLAQYLAAAPTGAAPAVAAPRSVEFHAEPGAPDGALYVDGQLVGFLPGVRRL